ncbi:hypothetical protein MJG53_003010 [Ovis ammon polii x Ovis aries]|uniref:Uncharacterized protein n=1 Tax=Ovis ammon polii x Ovis aries TaxID=2918886 RepID=A0ACB9VFB6_9CETA|nr:hypothetical protein MJT46_004358 [Ovis ammon polii x Ovis aries]KAI4588602.1 hypothetical protein MJG53_003010 [Ovis ammon polii x Ovis aries]
MVCTLMDHTSSDCRCRGPASFCRFLCLQGDQNDIALPGSHYRSRSRSLSQLQRVGATLAWCTGFSRQRLLLLQTLGSRESDFSSGGSWAFEHRLNSCGPRA